MNKTDILNLMILGRDRIYIRLEQVQKAGLTDITEMLIFKEEEIKCDKEKATKTIEEFKNNGGCGND